MILCLQMVVVVLTEITRGSFEAKKSTQFPAFAYLFRYFRLLALDWLHSQLYHRSPHLNSYALRFIFLEEKHVQNKSGYRHTMRMDNKGLHY